ncbi:MAG: 4'-phosphopantetheinyl transferase superfamily protein [Betaproteobacteria bacterium]|nr:MAG: 4'-phosphopantetheinyl transferase superfamily protein [Betaproteobacteria bacterium]
MKHCISWQHPPSHLDLCASAVDVWKVHIDDDQTDEPDLHDLSDSERDRASRFRFAVDRRRFVKSHSALRAILATYIGASPRALVFGQAVHGKPFLVAPRQAQKLRYNLSHSGDLALIAISVGREVGIDLERNRPMEDLSGVVNRFFSTAEREALARVAAKDREQAFLSTWVLKEAYLKASGEGLLRSLDAFDVTIAEDEPRLLEVRDRVGDASRWSLRRLRPRDDFVAALAVAGDGWQLRQWVWAGSSQPR